MNNYIIVGGGVAATAAIEGIRSVDTQGAVTVISEESTPCYCRPLISYYLENKTDSEKMKYRDDLFYEKMNCTVLYGKKAISLDKNNKNVTLDDGTVLCYSHLLIASGSSAFIPKTEGMEKVKNSSCFMTLKDAQALKETVNENTRVLIMGAGLIGLKCAEGLYSVTKNITVCDLANRVLSSILDYDSALIVQKHLEEKGISFLLEDKALSLSENSAIMQSGKTVDFDLLVYAVGVRPNIALIKDAAGKTDKGIIVDEYMRTDIENVYAAGDCTQSTDISCGENKVMALMPNAYLQGFCAGVNMAGGEKTFTNAIPMNSIGFFGLHIMTAGSYIGDVYKEEADGCLKYLYTKDDLLKGFVLIGCTERAGIYTSLIREKTLLSSIDFEKLKKIASSAYFSSKTRRKKFGGVI